MKDLKKDFESFAAATETRGSSSVLQKIHAQIEQELPSLWVVTGKMALAHGVGSVATLMSCSQFGVQIFFHGGGLMHYFMHLSPTFCHTFCGALYFTVTFLMARLILKYDEWLVILRSRVLSISSLALITLGGFSLVSHEVTLEAGLLWFFGAALGGELTTLIKSPRKWFVKA